MTIHRHLFPMLTLMGAACMAHAGGGSFWNGGDISQVLNAWSDDSGRSQIQNNLQIHQLLVDSLPQRFPANRARSPFGVLQTPKKYGVRIHKAGKVSPGYVLLSAAGGWGITGKKGNAILIDNNGNVIQEWRIDGLTAPKLLPNGHLLGGFSVNGENKLAEQNWCGKQVRLWDKTGTNLHHDHQREGMDVGYYSPKSNPKLDSAKSIMLNTALPPIEITRALGLGEKPTEMDTIREFDWNGRTIFEWNTWEHIQEFGLDEAAFNAIKLGLNDGLFKGQDSEDITHSNAISWVGENKHWRDKADWRFHPNNLVIDFRSLNITMIIARNDGGGFKAGEVVWKIGPDYTVGSPDGKIGQIIGQHQAHIIPEGLPGAGNMLLFDNGGGSGYGALIEGLTSEGGALTVKQFAHTGKPIPASIDTPKGYKLGHYPNKYRDFSRVIEFDPIKKEIIWQYASLRNADVNNDGLFYGNEQRLYSTIMSGAQRLPNGNTLITEAMTARVLEVTPKGEVVWEYVAELDGPAPLGKALYRATRVPQSWIPKNTACNL